MYFKKTINYIDNINFQTYNKSIVKATCTCTWPLVYHLKNWFSNRSTCFTVGQPTITQFRAGQLVKMVLDWADPF